MGEQHRPDFAILDLLSGGRAEIMAGRGSFIESLPLRFMAQISVGDLPHERALRAIELLGTEVAPRVREEVARRRAAPSKTAPAGEPAA